MLQLPAAAWLAAVSLAAPTTPEPVPRPELETRPFAERLKAVSLQALADREARSALAHLIELVESGLDIPGWLRLVDGGARLGNARGASGVDLAASYLNKDPLDAAATLWHEAQHIYDRSLLDSLKTEGQLSILFPLEAEQRGHAAGCLLQSAGRRAGLAGAMNKCEPFDLRLYACGFAWAAEQALWEYEPFAQRGTRPAEIDATLAAPAPSPPSDRVPEWARVALAADLSAERRLLSHCFEVERSLTGNALAAPRLPAWGVARCIEEAARFVLAPDWKSSVELCGREDHFGRARTDARVLARAVLRAP